MSRVEWTRYEGNDVEAVVAMLINREHPDSVRITPSSGDGGVDILDRGAERDGGDSVYQVKRHAAPLTSKQKEDVEASLDRLMSDPRWRDLRVSTWYLVTPWDPTPEAEGWLQGLGEARQLRVVWRGLTYIEQLAAKHSNVVDYYLYGGRSKVEAAYEMVSALFAADGQAASSDVPSVVGRLAKATGVLDIDPHYRYEVRIGTGEVPGVASRPRLMMTWVRADGADGADGQWVAVDVIARCAASVRERPITVKGTLRATPDSDFAHALRDFVDYGAPFTAPVGGFEGVIDAPGGLGGDLTGAVASILPALGSAGQDPELRVESIDSAGTVLASTELVRTDLSTGEKGLRVVLRQRNGLFQIEDRVDPQTLMLKRQFAFGDFQGEPVIEVRDAFEFLATCGAPNSVRMSRLRAGSETGLADPAWSLPFPAEIEKTLLAIRPIIDALTSLQHHTTQVVRVPDIFKTTNDQMVEWQRAAALLEGEEVHLTYPEGDGLTVQLAAELEDVEPSIVINLPFNVRVGEQELTFGTVEAVLSEPEIKDRSESQGRFLYLMTTADRRVTYRLPVAPAGEGRGAPGAAA